MLTCVYHPVDKMRVVEQDEADCLKATGVWFDSPVKASQYREKVENEINQESKADENPPKTKRKGKLNER
jgi:hypothetical protein